MTRVVTRGQANCAKELGSRVKADDGGLSALGLTSQHRLTYHKQTTDIRLTTWLALTN